LEVLARYEMFVPYVSYLFALVICGAALWKGDRPLRLAALVMIVSWGLSPLVSIGTLVPMDYPVTIIDTNVALLFVWISLRWRRLWCAVLAALTIIIVIIPLVSVADPRIHQYNHLAANNIAAWLQLVVFCVATWLAVRARRRADEGAVRP